MGYEELILDLDAFVNGVKEETGKEKVNYIGFRMGNTEMFYALENGKALTSSINKFIALAPSFIIMVPPLPEAMISEGLDITDDQGTVTRIEPIYNVYG